MPVLFQNTLQAKSVFLKMSKNLEKLKYQRLKMQPRATSLICDDTSEQEWKRLKEKQRLGLIAGNTDSLTVAAC